MRRLLAAVPVLVLVAACGGSSTPSATSSPTVSAEVVAYRAALIPSLDALYDGVQPFIDALAIVERPTAAQRGTAAPIYDVAESGRVLQAVQKQARTIAERLAAPPELAEGAKKLGAALKALETTLPPLLAAPGKDFAEVLNTKQTVFETALLDLDVAGEALFPADAQPTLPSSTGGVLGGARPPVSKAAVLYAAAVACDDLRVGVKKVEAGKDADGPTGIRATAALLVTAFEALVQLPVPAGDKAKLDAAVTSPLAPLVKTLPAAVDKALSGDAAAEKEVVRAQAAVDKAAKALGDYGSQTCEIAFDAL